MKTHTIEALVFLALLALSLALPLHSQPPAEANPQLRCLLFTAPDCAPCAKLKKELLDKYQNEGWRIDETSAADIQVIDVVDRPELKRKYRIRSWPYFVLVRTDGKEVARGQGLGAAALTAWISEMRRK